MGRRRIQKESQGWGAEPLKSDRTAAKRTNFSSDLLWKIENFSLWTQCLPSTASPWFGASRCSSDIFSFRPFILQRTRPNKSSTLLFQVTDRQKNKKIQQSSDKSYSTIFQLSLWLSANRSKIFSISNCWINRKTSLNVKRDAAHVYLLNRLTIDSYQRYGSKSPIIAKG
jgi:hypothetical protein